MACQCINHVEFSEGKPHKILKTSWKKAVNRAALQLLINRNAFNPKHVNICTACLSYATHHLQSTDITNDIDSLVKKIALRILNTNERCKLAKAIGESQAKSLGDDVHVVQQQYPTSRRTGYLNEIPYVGLS